MASLRDLKVERWPIGRLRVDSRNPRTHPPAQIRALVASIEEFGWTNPILVDPDGVIIAGEARLEAAKSRRQSEVPVIVLDGLTAAQRQAYRIADNRIPLDAGWDEALLAEVLAEISEAGLDLDDTGFNDDDLRALLNDVAPQQAVIDWAALEHAMPPAERIRLATTWTKLSEAEAIEDVAPPLSRPAPVTSVGDVWELGDHCLVCGDAGDPATVASLVVDADLVFTDPPYGMKYRAFGPLKADGTMVGDDLKGPDLIGLVSRALSAAKASSRAGAPFYVCLTWRTYVEFRRAVIEAGLEISACIVWDKGSIGLGLQQYRPQHEFIFYCAGAHWYGARVESDVWHFSRGATDDYLHPTQKPVALVRRALENSSLPGDLVLDLFGGSGSTLIACERTGRRARMVEIDAKYCDVMLRRWQDFSGGRARRLGDGAIFDDLVAKEAMDHDDSRRDD